ncbi:MAG: tetratricopeptide repeat protein [Lachnospiraceae bacterium]|nr:tetratricopeptide repeat protein [Lachnospiraceae bacterium]
MKKKDLKCIKSEQMSNRKVEILYIAHPDDYDRYFEAVSNGFLSIIGCNFYYGEPGVVPTEGELKKSKFDFVVMPVGKGLLKGDSEESRLYEELATKQYMVDNKNAVSILPVYTVENSDIEKLPELSDLLYQQLRFTEIQRAYKKAGKQEKKDMISFLTAFGYVKALGIEDGFLKYVSGENLMEFAVKLDEKYQKLWTLQPLGLVTGTYGRYRSLWSISGAFDDILEKNCLKDIELSKKYAEASGSDEGYKEVLPAYDYMVEYYIDHNKFRKAKELAEASLEYRLKLIEEKDFVPAKESLTLAYLNLGEIEYNLKHFTKAKKYLTTALKNADTNPYENEVYLNELKLDISEILENIANNVQPEKISKVGVMLKLP